LPCRPRASHTRTCRSRCTMAFWTGRRRTCDGVATARTAWRQATPLEAVTIASVAVVDRWIRITAGHVRGRAARCARSRSERAVMARPWSSEFPAGARVHRVVAVVGDQRAWRGDWLARFCAAPITATPFADHQQCCLPSAGRAGICPHSSTCRVTRRSAFRSVVVAALWHASFNFVTASPAASGFTAAVTSTLIVVWAVALLVSGELRNSPRQEQPAECRTGHRSCVSIWLREHDVQLPSSPVQ